MTRYINYFWYFIAGSLLIGFWSIVLIVAIPRPWYQFRSHAYHEVMMNVAKQIGFSADDAILEGGVWGECAIVFPICKCYRFVVFPTLQNSAEFQQNVDKSEIPSISSRENKDESYLFDYLLKSYEPVLKVNGELATWDYFESRDEGFTSFSWSYAGQQQRWVSINFFGIGEVHEPLQLFDKPFSDNFVVVKTEMGNYPFWACESGAHIIKK